MDAYIGRQPIFNTRQEVIAYQLLFRDGNMNVYETDGDSATKDVIVNSILIMGLDSLTGGKRAFIKFTQNLLTQGIAELLPAQQVAIEILEDTVPGEGVLAALHKLKQKGYMLVLNDLPLDSEWNSVIELADIIKVDFLAVSAPARRELANRFSSQGIKLLAEKVENYADFQEALNMGYSYFQGFFFQRPTIIAGKSLQGKKGYFLKIMREISKPEFSIPDIEGIISHDASLSYNLLMFINSAALSLPNKIKSIRHALTLLGQKEVCKWISLLMLRDFGADKPDELLTVSVIRAKFAEGIAVESCQRPKAPNAFLMGMMSLIDVLLEQPMERIVKEIVLDEEIALALLGESNELRHILELVVAFEKGDWGLVGQLAQSIDLSAAQLNSLYWNSVRWERELV